MRNTAIFFLFCRSPWRIVDDCGGAFTMGTVGGGVFQAVKGFRNSPVVSERRAFLYRPWEPGFADVTDGRIVGRNCSVLVMYFWLLFRRA